MTALDKYRIFPRCGAAVFMALTCYVVLAVIRLAQNGHELSDVSFAAVCGLVAVISGAAVKVLDYVEGEGSK